MMRFTLGIIAVCLMTWLVPGAASAHPMLDRAVAAYENADFELALRTFDTASRNADLTVEELLTLFEMRALVHHALGDDTAMRADLRRLVAVRDTYRLSRLAPPGVRVVFEEVREAHSGDESVELLIEKQEIEGAPWMVARLLRVPDELVDHVTLQCNIENNARTVSRTSRGTTTRVELAGSGVHHGCSATARTRQGGVLFSAQLAGIPALVGRSGQFAMPSYRARDEGGEAKKKKWPWIVAVSVAAVAVGVTTGVVVSKRSRSSSDSQPGGVTVEW